MRKFHTKNKRRVLSAFAVCAIISGTLVSGMTSSAESAIKSEGSLVLENGDVAFYASDVDAIQSGVEALVQEVKEEGAASPENKVRSDRLKSRGTLNYENGTIVLHAADLIYLAEEIDNLEKTYKNETLLALNQIHTYFDAEGSVTHEKYETDNPAMLTFSQLRNGILNSQTVTTDTTADNISKDKGAWVNGVYITGNGNDVNAAYAQGYKDGVDYTTENASISYTYHIHVKGDGTESEEIIYGPDNPGGCYTSMGHTHNVTGSCPVSGYHTVTQYMYCGSYHYAGDDDNGNAYYVCDACGGTANKYGSNDGTNDGGEHYKTVEVTDYDNPIYGCGSPANTWGLGCNKTTSTIESATIIFN